MILDTNVLIYAVGSEHPLRGSCRRLIAAIQNGEVAATTSVIAIQEFTYVYSRRRPAPDAVELARGYLDLLDPVLPADVVEMRAALDLVASSALLPSDALIAAAAIGSGMPLVTADRSLVAIPGLRTVYPDETGVSALLRT